MNRERLEHLIVVMQRVADQKLPFYMGSFFENSDGPLDCGTAACAAGWASRDPEFQRQGLTVHQLECWSFPSFNGLREWDSLKYFFDINSSQVDEIFGGHHALVPDTATPKPRSNASAPCSQRRTDMPRTKWLAALAIAVPIAGHAQGRAYEWSSGGGSGDTPYCERISKSAGWIMWSASPGLVELTGTSFAVAKGEGDTFELRRFGQTLAVYPGGAGEEFAKRDAISTASAICKNGGIP